jgi:hypothetical protein
MTDEYIEYMYLLVFLSSVYLLMAPKQYPLRDGTVVVITGGVQGLGLEIAKIIARKSKDITLVIVDIREDLSAQARIKSLILNPFFSNPD